MNRSPRLTLISTTLFVLVVCALLFSQSYVPQLLADDKLPTETPTQNPTATEIPTPTDIPPTEIPTPPPDWFPTAIPPQEGYLPLIYGYDPPTPTPLPTETPIPTETPQPTATNEPTSTPPPTATRTPTTTPIPATVFVRSSRSYTRSTSRYVVGEIINNLNRPVYFVKASVRFLDAGANLVAIEDTYVYLTETEPGQRNPFKAILSNAPSNIAGYDIILSWQTSGGLDYRPATVVSQQTRDNFGVEVFGDVRNDQGRELRGIEMAVTFYDSVGGVLDTDFGFPSASALPPGGTSGYKVSTFEDNLPYASYTVQAQGYLAP